MAPSVSPECASGISLPPSVPRSWGSLSASYPPLHTHGAPQSDGLAPSRSAPTRRICRRNPRLLPQGAVHAVIPGGSSVPASPLLRDKQAWALVPKMGRKVEAVPSRCSH